MEVDYRHHLGIIVGRLCPYCGHLYSNFTIVLTIVVQNKKVILNK